MGKLMMLELTERLENGDFILENEMVKLNQNKNSTRSTLFYCGNKSITHSTKVFPHFLQNCCSKNTRKFSRKV